MSTELNELDALALQAAGIDADAAAQAPGAVAEAEAQAAVMDLAQQNSQGVTMVLELASPMLAAVFPSLATVYTPETCTAVGGALGPVLAKYGFNIGEWGGQYKEEIMAAVVCWPVGVATLAAIRTDVAAKAAAAAKIEKPALPDSMPASEAA